MIAQRLFWSADTLSRSTDPAKWRQALPLWHRAAAIYEAGGYSSDVAFTWVYIARFHGGLGGFDSALVYYGRALPVWRKLAHRTNEGTTLNDIGLAHYRLSRPDSALFYFMMALSVRAGTGFNEAQTLYNIGGVNSQLGRHDSAHTYYGRDLAIRRELGDRAKAARALEMMGRVMHSSGRPDSALVHYLSALPIYSEVRDSAAESELLNQIGHVHRDRGRPDSALAYYARAMAIQDKTGDRNGQAQSLNNIGAIQSNLGRADSALAYYRRALPIVRGVGNRSGEAATRGNMGSVHFRLGRPDSALVYYHQALAITRDIRDASGQAASLNNIGSALLDIAQPDSALIYFARALAIAREIGDDESATLNNIGLAHSRLARPDSATVYYLQALAIERRIGDRAGEATSLNNIGVMQEKLGRPSEAVIYYRQALLIHRQVGSAENQAVALANIGHFFLSAGGLQDLLSAASAFDSAAAVHATMRRNAGGDANAVSVGETASNIFAPWSRAWLLMSDSAYTFGDSAKGARAAASALAAAERGRAQALSDLLHRNRGASRVSSEERRNRPGADLAAEAELLLAPLRVTRTALLYYLVDGDSLRTWFVDAAGTLSVLPAIVQPSAQLFAQLTVVREQIGADEAVARRRRGDDPQPGDAGAARRDVLGRDITSDLDPDAATAALVTLAAQVLPAGLTGLLAPGTELVIVPHGALGQLPFALLTLPGDTMPLGIRNPLRYSPSLRALAAADAIRDARLDKSQRRFVVVGNPEMPEVRNAAGRPRQLASLQGAAAEGAWVAARLGVPLLTGAAATEQTVRSLLSRASVVHLATHGLAYGTEARVRDSYVALAPGSGHDGLLTLGELLDDDSITLTADLFVLSACQTGLGESRQAEGTVGLQRGLLAKGARSVLVSLWSVDDAATRLLMERFYTHWLDENAGAPISKAEALRRAQRDVRANPSFANPRYWGAFQLVGAH
ncbi:MAG TPA: CHAT domain-containing tetratricopeptide repeat protein [Gemmatimonadaceae bacterium]|nr:CHAT domain-containing tetratricopeptide repeat protein [Gemmatimonadaceae bacterium]